MTHLINALSCFRPKPICNFQAFELSHLPPPHNGAKLGNWWGWSKLSNLHCWWDAFGWEKIVSLFIYNIWCEFIRKYLCRRGHPYSGRGDESRSTRVQPIVVVGEGGPSVVFMSWFPVHHGYATTSIFKLLSEWFEIAAKCYLTSFLSGKGVEFMKSRSELSTNSQLRETCLIWHKDICNESNDSVRRTKHALQTLREKTLRDNVLFPSLQLLHIPIHWSIFPIQILRTFRCQIHCESACKFRCMRRNSQHPHPFHSQVQSLRESNANGWNSGKASVPGVNTAPGW